MSGIFLTYFCVKQAVLRHSSKLKSEAKKLKDKTKASGVEDLPNASGI